MSPFSIRQILRKSAAALLAALALSISGAAIGALHLAGEDSVQRMLADRGVTVERLQ